MNKFSVLLCVFLIGCVETNQIVKPDAFDSKSVNKMIFSIRSDRDSGLKIFDDQQLADISEEISRRFTEAGYPITHIASSDYETWRKKQARDSGANDFTHLLEVSVGASEMTETPPGLSFTFGNTDPRSINYQKALTVPVTCSLQSTEKTEAAITLMERKTEASHLENLGLDSATKLEKNRRFYVENIGSTCHNLLAKLEIFPSNLAAQPDANTPDTTKHLWGGIRIKIEDDTPAPSIQQDAKDVTESPATPIDSTNAKTNTSSTTGDPETTNPQTMLTPPSPPEKTLKDTNSTSISRHVNTFGKTTGTGTQTPTKPTLSLKQNQTKDWRDKKVTIFNEGDTVILKFGYERR